MLFNLSAFGDRVIKATVKGKTGQLFGFGVIRESASAFKVMKYASHYIASRRIG